MTCRRAEELILRAPDGDLKPLERERLDMHLAACAFCQAAWAEQGRLTLLARRWVSRPAPTELPGKDFTAQVLEQIVVRPAPVRVFYWKPLLAVCLAFTPLFLLPHTLRPAMPDIGGMVYALPGWLLENGRLIPTDTVAVWASAPHTLFLPPWSWSLLAGALIVNVACYSRALQSRWKGGLS